MPARSARGWAAELEIDPDLIIPDTDRSLSEGAIVALEWNGPHDQGGYYWQTTGSGGQEYHIDLDAPIRELSPERCDMILYGTGDRSQIVEHVNRAQATGSPAFSTKFEGVVPNLERRYRETNSDYIRNKISEYMCDRPCPNVKGRASPGSPGGHRGRRQYRRS